MEARGRVSLPSSFRKTLAAVGSSDMIYVLPPTEAHPTRRMALSGPGFDAYCARAEESLDEEEYEAFAEKFIGEALPTDIDEAGRFVLSPAVREAMGLKGEVVFIGLGDYFEIRNPEAHDTDAASRGATADAAQRRVSRRGLHA